MALLSLKKIDGVTDLLAVLTADQRLTLMIVLLTGDNGKQ